LFSDLNIFNREQLLAQGRYGRVWRPLLLLLLLLLQLKLLLLLLSVLLVSSLDKEISSTRINVQDGI